jgi:hypothetical protein
MLFEYKQRGKITLKEEAVLHMQERRKLQNFICLNIPLIWLNRLHKRGSDGQEMKHFRGYIKFIRHFGLET